MGLPRTICIGYDKREDEAYQVAYKSCRRWASGNIIPIKLDQVISDGLYTRSIEKRDGRMWDPISEAPMSTEFAISRFLSIELAKRQLSGARKLGWVLFMDCDVLIRKNIDPLFTAVVDGHNDHIALACVQHEHTVEEGKRKMDGQLQVNYNRKNWSSVMLLNMDHHSNGWLNARNVNKVPGRDLHRFCWLEDHEIMGIDARWNYLVGHTKVEQPYIVHFTEGGPWLKNYETVEFADEWRAAKSRLFENKAVLAA